jgi:hypothetical protein
MQHWLVLKDGACGWQVARVDASSAGPAVLKLVQALLQHSLADPDALSQHPASVGPHFRLLQLALQHAEHMQACSRSMISMAAALLQFSPTACSHSICWSAACEGGCVSVQSSHASGARSVAAAMLHERVLAAALAWFGKPVAYFGGWTPSEAR